MNWFQIDTFMWWFTVFIAKAIGMGQLWIDFKLILLCDDSQLKNKISLRDRSCELISNWYFYVMIHSARHWFWNTGVVVNWFQIDTFMWWFTVDRSEKGGFIVFSPFCRIYFLGLLETRIILLLVFFYSIFHLVWYWLSLNSNIIDKLNDLKLFTYD